MKRKFKSILTLCSLFSLCVSSCNKGGGEESSESTTSSTSTSTVVNHDITSKELTLNNYATGYTLKTDKINVYFDSATNDVPYLSIKNMYSAMDGFYDYSRLSFDMKDNKNKLVVTESTYNTSVAFNWETDTIEFDDYDFASTFVIDSSTTNYSFNLYTLNTSFQTSSNEATFNLADYGFDILHYNDEVLVPLAVANIVLNSTNYVNLVYNTESVSVFYGSLDTSSDEYWATYTKSPVSGQKQTTEMRDATVNTICFLMDYYYGLKELKNYTKFKDWLNEESNAEILKQLTNKTGNNNNHGASKWVYKMLDEGHSAVISGNVYSKTPNNPTAQTDMNTTGNLANLSRTYTTLKNLRDKQTGYDSTKIRYTGDTAIFTIDSFDTGESSDIYNDDGSIKEHAWEYDTYFYMKHQLDAINTYNETAETKVSNVVIDLSYNGGGNMGALFRAVGFLKNDDVRYVTYDILTKRYTSMHMAVDVTNTGKVGSNPYAGFNYSVLTSGYTFSAANRFASIVYEQNLGKIIGQKSGGGMCSVFPTVLADGTFIHLSSSNTMRITTDEQDYAAMKEIESGIPVAASLELSDYYNDEKVAAAAKEAWSK